MPTKKALRLHHVGYAVREIEPVCEIYTRTYSYQVITPVIHEQAQTAFVQFLQLEGETSYLEFVAPDGPQSKLFQASKRGGSLNHLCYTAPAPLEEMIAALEQEGMRLIGVPTPSNVFGGRRICWLFGADSQPVELVERRNDTDDCLPGLAP